MKNTIEIGRDVGDCEIRSISFKDDDAYLKLFDPQDGSFFTIAFYKLVYLAFETAHAQNVIDSIIIFKSANDIDANSVPQNLIDALPKNITAQSKLAYIRPITGGESLFVFEEFAIQS
jgi:hypothetical protein